MHNPYVTSITAGRQCAPDIYSKKAAIPGQGTAEGGVTIMKEYEPDAVFPESNIIEKATFDGISFSRAKEYGVGMDCHRPFIQVNVLFWNNGTILEKRKEFGTDRALLCEARDWAEGILRTCASPPADVSEGIHYVIESTGACHVCVLGSWQAEPPGKEAGEQQGSGNRLRRQ